MLDFTTGSNMENVVFMQLGGYFLYYVISVDDVVRLLILDIPNMELHSNALGNIELIGQHQGLIFQ